MLLGKDIFLQYVTMEIDSARIHNTTHQIQIIFILSERKASLETSTSFGKVSNHRKKSIIAHDPEKGCPKQV